MNPCPARCPRGFRAARILAVAGPSPLARPRRSDAPHALCLFHVWGIWGEAHRLCAGNVYVGGRGKGFALPRGPRVVEIGARARAGRRGAFAVYVGAGRKVWGLVPRRAGDNQRGGGFCLRKCQTPVCANAALFFADAGLGSDDADLGLADAALFFASALCLVA